MVETVQTARGAAKEERRIALLDAAARLFAERGFAQVSLEDLGAEVGVSGPAVYRHFPSKQSVLEELLVSVSRTLLAGGQSVLSRHDVGRSALEALVAFHVDFALHQPDVIRVQDRDLASLNNDSRHLVRQLQRQYVDLWVEVLGASRPRLSVSEGRMRAHAVFGLINSTPHALRESRRGNGAEAPRVMERAMGRQLLERMALSALLSEG